MDYTKHVPTHLVLRQADGSVFARCFSRAEADRAQTALLDEEGDRGVVAPVQVAGH